MKESGSKKETIQAWSDITIKMWMERIVALDVWDQGFLYDSFVNHVISQAGGDASKIDFLFKLYGIYSDMGVGKETRAGNSGDLSEHAYFSHASQSYQIRRKAKPWYSRIFFREVMKLKEFMASRYGIDAAGLIVEKFSEAFDQRSNSGDRTISSLRTMVYRNQNNARWAKNYKAYGFREWKSRNHH